MTKFVKGLSGQPFTNDQTSGFDLGVDALRNDGNAVGHGLEAPSPTVGISTPGDIEIGISTPATDDLGGTAPAGGGSAGLGEWIAVEELTIAEDNDDLAGQKGGGGSPNSANPAGSNIGVLLPLGTNPDGSHFFSGVRNVDATLIGSKWGTLNLTFSFPTTGSNYADNTFDPQGVSNYHIDAGVNQQAAARAAFAQIAAATGLTFTEIADSDTVHANIRISQTADQDDASAFGNFPSDTSKFAGDIWFGRNNQPFYDMNFKGSWGFSTMLHEIGHTMGLKHGHQDYTNADLSQYLGTSPRFGSQSLTPDRDGQAWSLMTYSPAPFVGQPFAGDKISQPQTYMQYDLAALQYMYGANYNTNSGDSVYTFSQTTGEMFINGVGQGAPNGNRIFLTIWDGGGNDTINASNYAGGVTIDLRPGEFSTVDQAQLVNNLAYRNTGVSMAPGNFAMSLLYNNDARSLIENATGGNGNDIFIGNTANNVLSGGAGSDSVIFTNTTGVNVTLNDTNTDVIVNHDGETDTLRSIENIGGTSGNDTITGNSQDNVLTGGSGGTDVLSGLGGNDRLVGGGFTVVTSFVPGVLPSQPDITKPQATNNNSIANAFNTAGFYDVDANANITSATTIPHATINATATGGSLEYYRIDVTAAGAQAIFDIDGGGTLDDSILELVDSLGNVIGNNDTGSGDASFPGHDDAYLNFTFAAAGTYYIRVGRFINPSTAAQPMLAGTTYQLHISLQGAAGATVFTLTNTASLVADGGAGNDVLVGTVANDTLAGGADNDTASFVNAYNNGTTTGVTVNLNLQGAAQNTVAAGNDTLTGIENLIGSALNDTLTGDANANVIEGGLGDDTMVGGAGDDTASYASAAAAVTVSLALQGAGQNTGGAGTDTLSGFQNLLGSANNDTLTGDAFENVLTGGAGDDTLNPGANAGGTVDLLDGGIGSDTASFAGYASGVTATLNGAIDGVATVAGQQIAALRSIENLTGSSNGDTLTGDNNNNVIEGGLGDDTLVGGGGIDTVRFTGATAVTLNLATLTAQATGWGNDTISGFENVRTGSGADNITGDGNDNTFFDGGGGDIYNGAGGVDTVDYTNIAGAVTVNLNTAGAQNANTGGDTLSNIENVNGSLTGVNTLTGNTVANQLTGGAAGDTIVGNNGNDVIFGGAGDDFLLGGTSAALDDGSADTIEGGLGNDYLSGGLGNDILRGGDGDDTLVGTIGATTGGFFANDGGDDTYDGGDGTDIAIMAYENRLGVGASTVGISFDLRSMQGDSAITFNGVNVGQLTSIERVTFRGTAVNDEAHGSGFVDSLTGNDGNDILDGWLGNDTLNGGLGDDTLTGGEGLDMVTYVNATAGITVDLRLDGVAQNTGVDGMDTLSGIEYVTGSAFGDTLRGTDDFNLMIDTGIGAGATALSQTDSLFGFAGNDSMLVTRAAGGVATNINLDGGDGDDFIEVRSGTLSAGLATNTAGLIGQTYAALGATSNDRNVDVVDVIGGAGNDRIILTGVASATVNAGSGADIVSISMRGLTTVNNYVMSLGTGADIIQFGAGSNAAASTDVMTTARTNRVNDFEVGNSGDKFEMTTYLANGVLAGSGYVAANGAFASGHMRLTQSGTDLLLQVDRDGAGVVNTFVTVFAITGGYTGGFTAFNFDGFIGNLTLTGQGALNETITGATGNDVLSGAAGNDTLNGLGGTDTLEGGTGNDNLNGGTGTDTAVYQGARADYTILAIRTNGVITGYTVTDNNLGNGDEGTDTLNSIENISFLTGPSTLSLVGAVAVFDASNNLVSVHATIQAAIDAVTTLDGYKVVVSSGTYAENLTVSKDLTIVGTNDGIAGTDGGSRVAETIINGQVTVTANGVTIDGVNIIGAAPGSLGNTGLEVIGNNFSLVNSILNGTADTAIITGTVTGLDIGRNLITGYSIGIYVSGNTTAGSIHNNTIQGNGAGSGTGIQEGVFLETSHVILDSNTFAGIDGGSIFVNPHGPDAVDLRDIVLNTIITGSGVDRPIQVLASTLSTHLTGTDFNEAMYDPNQGGAGEIIDNLYFDGQGGDDHIFGNSLADTLLGGSGSDEIYGGGGDDALNGGTGDDLLDGEAGVDTATFADNSLGYASTAIGWLVSSADGNDFLQRVEITVDGTGQRSLLVGATAFGTIQAAFNAANAGDYVRLANGSYSGTSTYSDANLSVIAQPGAVLNVTFSTAGTDGITVYGAGGADTITTGAGNDLVYGGAGVDHLNGAGGNDTLNGGTSADVLAGGTGDDYYFVDTGDQVIELAGQGNDRVFASTSYTLTTGAEVETMSTDFHAGTAAINLTGNELANTIVGNDGDNFLNGGLGADVLVGRLGNDFYFIDNAGDQVFEAAGQGSDRVFTGVSYTLAAGADIEVMSTDDNAGTAAINLTGNELANIIFGNAGDNVLNGGLGADTLVSNGGNDTFAFTTALGGGNVDVIADFQTGSDKIGLDDAVFTAIGGLGALNPNAFFAGTAAHDADDRIIYDVATGNLFYDADGNGAGAAVLFANLNGTPVLTASDFVVI